MCSRGGYHIAIANLSSIIKSFVILTNHLIGAIEQKIICADLLLKEELHEEGICLRLSTISIEYQMSMHSNYIMPIYLI